MIQSSEITVSVCMITYGHEKYLEMAINGVLLQKTNFKVELIISDDASPDKSENVVKKFLNNSNGLINVVYHKHSKNKGAISNFIWSFYKCTGKYIALCEGDDFWTDPNKLQRQVDFLENNSKYVLSFHDRSIVNTNGELIKENSLPGSIKRDLNFEDLAKGIYTVPTQTVVFRNCIKRFPIEYSSVLNGDTFLFLLLAEHGNFFYDREIKGATYRVHQGGVWSSISYEKSLLEGFKTYKIVYNHFNKNTLLSKALINRQFGLISFYWKNHKSKKFIHEFKSVLGFVILNPELLRYFFSKSFRYFLNSPESK